MTINPHPHHSMTMKATATQKATQTATATTNQTFHDQGRETKAYTNAPYGSIATDTMKTTATAKMKSPHPG